MTDSTSIKHRVFSCTVVLLSALGGAVLFSMQHPALPHIATRSVGAVLGIIWAALVLGALRWAAKHPDRVFGRSR